MSEKVPEKGGAVVSRPVGRVNQGSASQVKSREEQTKMALASLWQLLEHGGKWVAVTARKVLQNKVSSSGLCFRSICWKTYLGERQFTHKFLDLSRGTRLRCSFDSSAHEPRHVFCTVMEHRSNLLSKKIFLVGDCSSPRWASLPNIRIFVFYQPCAVQVSGPAWGHVRNGT